MAERRKDELKGDVPKYFTKKKTENSGIHLKTNYGVKKKYWKMNAPV